MKKRLIQIVIAILIATSSFAQIPQQISISKKSATVLDYNVTGAKKIEELNTNNEIIIRPESALKGILNYVLTTSDGQDVTNAFVPDQSTGKILGANGKVLNLIIKANGFNDLIISDIGKEFTKTDGDDGQNDDGGGGKGEVKITALEYMQSGITKPIFSNDPNYVNNITSGIRYISSHDRAYIVLDENGKLIGNIPVNLDQDDKIYIYLVVNENDINKYDLEVIGGEYAPIDLQIRSYDKISDIGVQGSIPNEWTIIRFERGPYTSDNVTFNIKKTESINSKNETKILSTYSVNINKLYHVAIGASFISTNVAKPDFDLFPLSDSTNTLNTLNGGSRTMFTFNVIWYWQNTFKYLKKGSDITRGRDILKEPNWKTRLNPTFGVTIDDTFRENFFIGGTYEFARGGSICFGGHYGKIKELATKAPDGSDFMLGESIYTGTKDDIKLTDSWKWGFFFGITLDTRIFNKVLARN